MFQEKGLKNIDLYHPGDVVETDHGQPRISLQLKDGMLGMLKPVTGPHSAAPESVVDEAVRLVNGPRQETYSHPFDDFSRTAKIWSGILGIDVTPAQVALCMVGVKISRECHLPKRDNLVDAHGYLLTLEMVYEKEKSPS